MIYKESLEGAILLMVIGFCLCRVQVKEVVTEKKFHQVLFVQISIVWLIILSTLQNTV